MTVYETWRAACTTATYGEWLETEAGRSAVATREQEAARGPGVPWVSDREAAIDVIVHGYRETVRLERRGVPIGRPDLAEVSAGVWDGVDAVAFVDELRGGPDRFSESEIDLDESLIPAGF